MHAIMAMLFEERLIIGCRGLFQRLATAAPLLVSSFSHDNKDYMDDSAREHLR